MITAMVHSAPQLHDVWIICSPCHRMPHPLAHRTRWASQHPALVEHATVSGAMPTTFNSSTWCCTAHNTTKGQWGEAQATEPLGRLHLATGTMHNWHHAHLFWTDPAALYSLIYTGGHCPVLTHVYGTSSSKTVHLALSKLQPMTLAVQATASSPRYSSVSTQWLRPI